MKKPRPDAGSSTIIASPLQSSRKAGHLLSDNPRIDLLPDGLPGPRHFKIKCADSFERRRSVGRLLKDRYLWRGYIAKGIPHDQVANRVTLSALEHDMTIGTLTVGLDSAEGLNSDECFRDINDAFRAEGQRLCEFTKFAIDSISGTKRVLAALFHVAFILAYRINKCDVAVIEVNPRHVRFYERMLGFTVKAPARLNRSVGAPAVLLSGELKDGMTLVENLGGKADVLHDSQSLYPFFFSIEEEIKIVTKLLQRSKVI